MTKPDRSLSNGREDSSGLSLYAAASDFALMSCFVSESHTSASCHIENTYLQNPAIARGWMQASEPPATMTSASSNCMNLMASPME